VAPLSPQALVAQETIEPRTEQTCFLVGTAPVNWNNDDVPGWAPRVPFATMLSEMAAAGYSGTEYGAGFPTDSSAVRQSLDEHGLQLCGSYQWLRLTDDATSAVEQEGLESTLELLAESGARHLIVATAMTTERIQLAGHVPSDGSAGIDDQAWDALARNLATVTARAARWNIKTHYHNHVGTYVETPDEVEQLISLLPGTGADLCFDTGHYAYGGGDPTGFVAEHSALIGYLHLKDVDPVVLIEARDQGWSFLQALRHCIFCEFGDGIVDIPRVISTLGKAGYDGWVIVEQDTSGQPAIESARASREYLRTRCEI